MGPLAWAITLVAFVLGSVIGFVTTKRHPTPEVRVVYVACQGDAACERAVEEGRRKLSLADAGAPVRP